MNPARRSFGSKEDLAVALAEAVGDHLVAGIERRGSGSIAVSGGTTPSRFFGALGKRRDIAWENVFVTLVDERWVPETHDRSNAGLVNERMLQGPAATARFIPLFSGGDEPDAAAIARTNALQETVPMPFDAVVLGMGNDGHTASFFPGGDTLDAVLQDAGPALAIRAPGAGEPRVTLTLPRLLETGALYLHIEGEEKEKVLGTALEEGPVADLPVRAVLRQTRTPLTVFWCP